jgi:Fe-S oxidoreductase
VILWPDTFNNHFTPETARAAVSLLEATGFTVELPRGWVCCGRPLYDFGFLGHARRLLRRTIRLLREEVRAGVPIVFLEPSCASVFRDELTNMLPRERDAHRLREQVVLLSELLDQYDVDLPRVDRNALVQAHCHHSSVLGLDAERAVMSKIGLHATILDSGCCGMAGAFGFERGDHYDVSMRCAERMLLPAVRSAPASTLVLADGFSCRQQIAQGTSRTVHHLADVLGAALAGTDVDSTRNDERCGP